VRGHLRLRGDDAPEVDGELLRAAQELRGRGFRTVGLLPASGEVRVAPVALQLGLAISLVGSAPTAVVDAAGAWAGDGGAAAEGPFGVTPITPLLSLLTPAGRAATLGQLEDLLADDRAPARRLVVTLDGFERTGEHLAAIALLDGVSVVARAGRTKLPDVERRVRELPAGRSVGVLLVE
jgi:hypothetical protein